MSITSNFLDQQRLIGDEEADRLIQQIFAAKQQSDLYALLKLNKGEVEQRPYNLIKEFLLARKPQPVWFNQRQVQRGQQLFKQYALEMMALLGAMSLPYCYAASPGNKALYLSDKMRNSPGKRLLDTATFVIAVLTPGTLHEDGTGYFHINKVRLIHALSRFYVGKQPTWNMDWGVPINQEDMAGTNLAFSYVILLGMQQSGFSLSQTEKEDFIFLWRYIGYQLGIDERMLPNDLREAQQLAGIIKYRNFKKTEEGIILTDELVTYYKSMVPKDQAKLITAQIRFYLGNEVAGYLGLPMDTTRDSLAEIAGSFKAFQNFLAYQPNSYQQMLIQHAQLKERFIR